MITDIESENNSQSYTLRTTKFRKEDIVWAKIEGYPRWPGTIIDIKLNKDTGDKEFLVNFIGERSHATLPENKLTPYDEDKEANARHATKALRKAILIADDIQAGKTTQEEEDAKMLMKKRAMAKKAALNLKRRKLEAASSVPPLNTTLPSLQKDINDQLQGNIGRQEKRLWNTFEQEKHYLKELLLGTDPKKVLAGQRTVEKFIKTLSINALKLEQMLETRIGIALQDFFNNCSPTSVLSQLRQKVGRKIEELKTDVILTLFGMDTSCNIADLVEQTPDDDLFFGSSDAKLDTASGPEPMADASILDINIANPQSADLQKIGQQENGELKENKGNENKNENSEDKKDNENSSGSDSSSDEESGSESSSSIVGVELETLAVDTILMISACQEFTQLLEKVYIFLITRFKVCETKS